MLTEKNAGKDRKAVPFWVWPLSLLALVGGLVVALHLSGPEGNRSGTVPGSYIYDPPRALTTTGLIDHDGQPLDLSRWKGRWVLVNFGYLSCPDICPITLGILKQTLGDADMRQRLGQLTVLYATADPQRDTPERLKEFLGHFGDYFIGIAGSEADLREFGRQLNTVFVRQEPTGADEAFYTVSHSSSVALINPDGKFQAMLKGPESGQQLRDFLTDIISGS